MKRLNKGTRLYRRLPCGIGCVFRCEESLMTQPEWIFVGSARMKESRVYLRRALEAELKLLSLN